MNGFLSLDGRMRRKEYAMVAAGLLIITVALALASRHFGGGMAFRAATVLVGIASIPATVRRLHDIGYSGWLCIGVALIPYISLIVLLAPGEPGKNAYGPNPRTASP